MSAPPGPLRLLLVGFGHVGGRLAEILATPAAYPGLEPLDCRVIGILTSSRGCLVDPGGIDLERALAELASDARFAATNPQLSETTVLGAIESPDYDVLVEMSPLTIDTRGEPAITHVRTALERGRHVVSCNKGPVAWAWRELTDLAHRKEVLFLHESAVMDGVPVFNLARAGLCGNVIERLAGILNSTTNFILGAMERGLTPAVALDQARAGGFVEADPALDLDGWDAAVKITCLANVLMDADLRPEAIVREGTRDVTTERVIAAREAGRRLKLVCEAEREATGTVHARVSLREIPLSDPFALVEGTSSLLAITTDLLGKIVITEQDPDLAATAYGVISDLFTIRGATAASRR